MNPIRTKIENPKNLLAATWRNNGFSSVTQVEVTPRYWMQTTPPHEVDFLIQRENDIFPVKVKSESNTSSKRLRKFKELFPEKVKLRVRFSLDNLKLEDDVMNIPFFMVNHPDRLGIKTENKTVRISIKTHLVKRQKKKASEEAFL